MNTITLSSNLGQSSSQRNSESQELEFGSNTAPVTKVLCHVKAENDIQKQQKKFLQELHIKRVQCLRKELEYLKVTEWKYQPDDHYNMTYM